MIDSRDAAIITKLRKLIEHYLSHREYAAEVEHYCRGLAAMTGSADAADVISGDEFCRSKWGEVAVGSALADIGLEQPTEVSRVAQLEAALREAIGEVQEHNAESKYWTGHETINRWLAVLGDEHLPTPENDRRMKSRYC